MGEIALTNTINVTLSGTPSGLGEFSTNTILLASNETPLNTDAYLWAVNAKEIINAYGSNSETAKMGQALFTQVPNLRTGKGQVLVVPYVATNATSANTKTVAITATIITALKALSSADLTITIDGVDYHVSGLNFTNISTVADVVKILQAQNLDCDIAVVDTNKIQFTSRRYGATDSDIALKATTAPAGTDIYGSSYFDGANQTEVAGVDATGTALKDVVALAEDYGYFGAILTTQKCENTLVVSNATAIQATDHIYFEATKSHKNIGILGASIKSASLTKTRLNAYSGDEKLEIASYASIACSTNYSGNDTALTMNLKELAGVASDENLNQTYYNLAKTNGVDIYGSTCGLSCVYSFSNGEYTDEATMDLWLKKALEVAGFNYLRKTNTKIPQTEAGMTGLKNAYIQVLEQGVRNGCIGVGNRWNDSIPFGDAETFQDNIEQLGYYIYSIPVSEQSQTERENRQAPLVQIAVKRSGAIHSSNLVIQVQA